MSLGGFTLADRLGARTVPCRVSGCSRTWIQLGGKALALGKTATSAESNPDDPSAGMCEPCKKKFASLHDKQRRCDVPGCQNTWTWPAAAQLEAFASHRQPPKQLCTSCENKLAALEDKQIACTVPGCTRTGTLTKRQQLLAENALGASGGRRPRRGDATGRPGGRVRDRRGGSDGDHRGRARRSGGQGRRRGQARSPRQG